MTELHHGGGKEKSRFFSLFERVGSKLFLGLVFLLPLFIVPLEGTPFELGKTFIIYAVALISAALFLLAVITDGSVTFPRSSLLLSLLSLVVVSAISAFTAPDFFRSFFGHGYEIDTTFFLAAMGILVFLLPALFRTRQAIFNMEAALFVSFLILALFHIVRLVFGADVLSFGVFSTATATPVGSWNDLGVLSGLIAVLSLVALELLPAQGVFFIMLHASLFLSLIFLAVVNFSALWVVLGTLALIFIVYSLSFRQMGANRGKKSLPILPTIIILLSLLFIFADGPVGSFVSNTFGLEHITARPSWTSTFSIAGETLKTNPFLGVGPNHFSNEWVMHKSVQVNQSPFWNIDFNFGIGLIPTALITLGLLGALSWFAYFVSLMFGSFRAIDKLKEDSVGSYVVLTTAAGTLFLFLINVIYTPSAALYALSFIFAGLFLSSLVAEGLIRESTFSFGSHPSRNFASVLVAIILLLGIVVSAYMLVERSMAFFLSSRALTVFNDGRLDDSISLLNRAVSLSNSDDDYRSLSQALLSKLSQVAQQTDAAAEVVRSQFQTTLASAVSAGRGAVTEDSGNYRNWLSLGQVYEAVVPLNIAGSYENAAESYKQAALLNPTDPSIELVRARLEQAHGNTEQAKVHIAEALKRKSNYTDAIFLLSQIEVSEGNLKGAIQSVEAAAVIDATNPVVFFQLGLLRYNNKDYRGAISALEQAISLQSSYANARYFLGLSYDKVSRVTDAIAQFEEIQKSNPDNSEIKLILTNLRAGRSPFSNAKAPVDSKPENRKTLPIKEKGTL